MKDCKTYKPSIQDVLMRLFIAVDLDEKTRESISGLMNGFAGSGFDVKWVEPVNIHLTLKFLGEVDEGRIMDVERSISDAVKDVKAFRMSVSDVGYFGSPVHVKVIWVGVKQGRQELIMLSRVLERELSHIRKEEHEPSPHITIGRVRSGRNREELLRDIEKASHVKFGEVDVKEIKLKCSVLGREGPVYMDVKVFSLGET